MPDGTGSENPVMWGAPPNDYALIPYKTAVGAYLCQGMCRSCWSQGRKKDMVQQCPAEGSEASPSQAVRDKNTSSRMLCVSEGPKALSHPLLLTFRPGTALCWGHMAREAVSQPLTSQPCIPKGNPGPTVPTVYPVYISLLCPPRVHLQPWPWPWPCSGVQLISLVLEAQIRTWLLPLGALWAPSM